MRIKGISIIISFFLWGSLWAQQDTLPWFPSARGVVPVVRTAVIPDQTGKNFNYKVTNQSSATQRIWDFYVELRTDSQYVSSPSGWESGMMSRPGIRLVTWMSTDSTKDIRPNNSMPGFSLHSEGLPTIVTSYASGYLEGLPDSGEVEYAPGTNDALFNSVQVYTVGPWTPPTGFYAPGFVDTTISLVVRSRTLGWITAQPTADKYSSILGRIRSDIVSLNPKSACIRIDTILAQANIDSSSTLTSEAYAIIRYNSAYLQAKLRPSSDIRGGLTLSVGGVISVRAKPVASFGTADTMKTIVATLRWPAMYNVTMGTVSGSYSFAKYDSTTTIGSFRYQKFRTTTSQMLSWTAGSEYELFTVPMSGLCGAETFQLTNALSGGEWFVDINYLDKTDSVFYQPTAQGFAYQNKSAGNGATAYSGERHAVMHGTKFHEVYESAAEIIYRRKDLNSAGWDTTTRISSGNGSNNDASICVAHDGSVHVVWQRQLNANAFALWYNKSTDGGFTWGTPSRPASAESIAIVQQNQWNIYPLISERGTSQLMIVVCSSTGPKYMVSTNLGGSWDTLKAIPNVSNGLYVWHPSLAAGSNYLLLTYDSRYYGVYSKKYDGTNWLSETSVNSGVGTIYDRISSVTIDIFDIPQVAWTAQRSGQSEYRILYKSGIQGGTGWSSTYTEFSHQTGISDNSASISTRSSGGYPWRIDMLYGNSSNQVWLRQFGPQWGSPTMVSSTGQWPTTTVAELTSPNADIRLWTDQSGSGPYEIMRTSDGSYQLQSTLGPSIQTEIHRRVTLESVKNRSFISFEVGPLKVVGTAGDTTTLPFKPLDPSKPLNVTLDKAWDYLGTDSIVIPPNTRSLIVNATIETTVRRDTLGNSGQDVFPTRSFSIELANPTGKTSAFSDTRGSSGVRMVNIAPWAGQKVVIRPVGTAVPSTGEMPVVGVGDIYVEKK